MSDRRELAVVGFDREQVELLKRTLAKDATDDELALFLTRCKVTGLDPFAGQIHFTKRKGKIVIQTGIDGYRALADDTGKHAGTDEPVFTGEGFWQDGRRFPLKATVTVYKMVEGERVQFVASCLWDEYYPGDGDVGGWMWRKMPYGQLSKCAEALALRKAFPKKISGLYVEDELHQSDDDRPARTVPAVNVQTERPALPPKPAPKSPPPAAKTLGALLTEAGKKWPDAMAYAKNHCGFTQATPATKFGDVPAAVIEKIGDWLGGLIQDAAEKEPAPPEESKPAPTSKAAPTADELTKLAHQVFGDQDFYEMWLHNKNNGCTPEMVGMMTDAGRIELREKILAEERATGFGQGEGIPQ